MEETQKIRSFIDLDAWKQSHQLVISIYQLTKNFPREETYSLTDQMKRCSVSISSNIAEGFSRRSKKEKIQFYYMAKGSLTELQNQLLVAKDVEYISREQFNEIAEHSVRVHKLINGLIRSLSPKS